MHSTSDFHRKQLFLKEYVVSIRLAISLIVDIERKDGLSKYLELICAFCLKTNTMSCFLIDMKTEILFEESRIFVYCFISFLNGILRCFA